MGRNTSVAWFIFLALFLILEKWGLFVLIKSVVNMESCHGSSIDDKIGDTVLKALLGLLSEMSQGDDHSEAELLCW